MAMQRRLLLMLGLCGLAAAMAQQPARGAGLFSNEIALDHAGPDAGVVVIGLGFAPGGPGTYYQSYTLTFRRADAAEDAPKGYLSFKPGMWPTGDKPDYEERGDRGRVIVASLPAGQYQIVDFGAMAMVGSSSQHFSLKNKLSHSFKVEEGKVVYLGHYRATGLRGKNLFGMPLPAGVVWDVGSRMGADLDIARARNAKLPAEVLDLTPAAADLGNPVFKDRKID